MRSSRSLVVAAAIFSAATAFPTTAPAHAHPTAGYAAHSVIFAGMRNGVIYRSTDGGAGWQETDNNGLPSSADVTALVVAPSAINTVYAGTNGSGVYVSTDGGHSWQDDNAYRDDLLSADITALAVNPRDSRLIYAAGGSNVYSSNDGGRHWYGATVATYGAVTALALDPRRPSTLIAGTSDTGVWVSTDNGADWFAPDTGIGQGQNLQVNQIIFNPLNADVAFAATANGIYQTIDAGQSWQQDARGVPDGTSFQSIAVNPHDGAQVVAGTSDGALYRSTDGGTSWTFTQSTGSQVNALLFDPGHDGNVLAGTLTNTFYQSGDNGADWRQSDAYLGYNPGILCLAASASPSLPTNPVPAPYGNPPGVKYFSASHHIVRGPLLSFYNRNGGLRIFGLPLTESFDEGGQIVQYFERARLARSGSAVTITPLGVQFTAGRYFPRARPFYNTTNRYYFPNSGHSLSGRFLTFWRSHNGGFLFGVPISEPLYEQNGDGTGRAYLVQYFDNSRLEYHPELVGTPYVVSIGQLGRQTLKQRGWL